MAVPNYTPPLNVNSETFGVKLNPADYNFMALVLSEVTEEGQLPFTIPVKALPRIIWKSSKWFYREDDESVEERWYLIRKGELQEDNVTNKIIQLPECIETVSEAHLVNGAMSTGLYASTFSRFYSEPLYNVVANYSNKPYGQNIRPAQMDMAVEESVAHMFEMSYMQSMFGRHVRFSFNPTSKKFNVLGQLDNDIVISTFQRLPLEDMYKDDRFFKHVIGNCLISIKRILNQFNFEYPGEISINFDELQELGKDMVDKIEDDIRENSSGADWMIIN